MKPIANTLHLICHLINEKKAKHNLQGGLQHFPYAVVHVVDGRIHMELWLFAGGKQRLFV